MLKKKKNTMLSYHHNHEEEEEEDDISSEENSEVETANNHIYFYKEVSVKSIKNLNQTLHLVDKENQKLAIDLDLPSLPPLHLHVSSNGGDLYAGFNAVSAIKGVKSPIITYVEGGVASAATLITLSGSKRVMSEYSFILIHQLTTGFWGTFEQLKTQMINKEMLMKKIFAFYLSTTKITEAQLDELLKTDLWLPAEKALEYGFVDEIIP